MITILNEEVKSDFWSKEIILSKLPLKSNDQLRIMYSESSKGNPFLAMRAYYQDGDDYYPTKKGITIPLTKDTIDTLEAILNHIKTNYDIN